MSDPIRIIEEGPLMLVTYYGAATDEQYEAYLAKMTRFVAEKRDKYTNMVVINDTTRWIKSNANQRRMQADWIAEHAQLMRERTAGVAFVISSTLVRGGLTAVLWLTKMPCDYKIVATLEEAFAWGRELQGAHFPERVAREALEARAREARTTG
jgi:hypothetical protein